MVIPEKSELLLFRYSNYGKHLFLNEHQKILARSGHVWMLKIGRKTNKEKIRRVSESGAWMVLRSPKADGSQSFISHFSNCSENEPDDQCFPEYYNELIHSRNENLDFYNKPSFLWFRIESIFLLPKSETTKLIVSVNGKSVDNVIATTRTAFMFIQNNCEIIF